MSNRDLGNDPDGDLDGYDGGYGPIMCSCPTRPRFGPKISCPSCGGKYEAVGMGE